ncbi:hypothetical protein QOZ96_003350 [Brevundimonas nasdae]|uniref:hypothetical protein n=1 Tax=Brevundimonas nasdae TaxID=172043 RepID=UPI001914C14F|nr:hypothetical protein [Brevundimonas nasdae]MBK6026813.1 hypothetical protein [Brevundimonas nasdae]MDQ0453380.1 hypothetical protein [Brevundimonas nasdae]
MAADERRFLLFHCTPPPVDRYLIVPGKRGLPTKLVAVKVAAQGDGKRAEVPFASYERIAEFFLSDMSVDVAAVMKAGAERADADVE